MLIFIPWPIDKNSDVYETASLLSVSGCTEISKLRSWGAGPRLSPAAHKRIAAFMS